MREERAGGFYVCARLRNEITARDLPASVSVDRLGSPNPCSPFHTRSRSPQPYLPRLGNSSLSLLGAPSLPPMADQLPDQAASNSLGLDLAALKIKDSPDPAEPKPSADAKDASPAEGATQPTDQSAEIAPDAEQADAGDDKKDSKEKKKPYVNPDRVKTGGAQRVRPCMQPPIMTRPDRSTGQAERGRTHRAHGAHP